MAFAKPAMAPIQTRFDGGLISPRLRGRFDSDLYKKALAECSNFEPLPQGSLRMRAGTEKNFALAGVGTDKRLMKIHASTGEDFIVEVLDNAINIYDVTTGVAVLNSIGTSELVINGGFSVSDGAAWQNVSKPAAGGAVLFNDGSGPPPVQFGYADIFTVGVNHGILYQKIKVAFDASIRIKFRAGCTPFKDMTVKVSSTDPAGWAGAGSGGEKVNVNLLSVSGGVGGTVPELPAMAAQDLGDFVIVKGDYWISFQGLQNSNEEVYIDDVSVVATYAGQTSIPAPWLETEGDAIKYVTETGRDRTIFVHPRHHPFFLLYGGTPGNWSWGDVVFTTTPLGWGDIGSANVPADWNWKGLTTQLAEANWPSSVEITDNRAYYGGEPAQKNRIVGSKSGALDNFTLGINPGDSLDFKISTKGAIQWIRTQKAILVGTDTDGHVITGSQGTPLVGDFQAPQESAYPCASIQGIAVGTQIIYASADTRRVRAAAFSTEAGGWDSKDLTFIAEHLTDPLQGGGYLKEIHHAYTPDSVLIIVRTDGKLAIAEYEPTESVIAWWVVDVGGSIYSAAVQESAAGAALWMAVGRTDGVTYLERLPLSELANLRYLDASIAAVADADGVVIGADHLNGQTVRVVVQGGGYLGEFPIGSDGKVLLGADNAGVAVYVGLKFLARAKTLPRDLRAGRAQSPTLGVILNNSALPLLNGKRAADRSPSTPMDTPEPLVTGKRSKGNLGWSDEDGITIEQDLPFRTEVCALYTVTQAEHDF